MRLSALLVGVIALFSGRQAWSQTVQTAPVDVYAKYQDSDITDAMYFVGNPNSGYPNCPPANPYSPPITRTCVDGNIIHFVLWQGTQSTRMPARSTSAPTVFCAVPASFLTASGGNIPSYSLTEPTAVCDADDMNVRADRFVVPNPAPANQTRCHEYLPKLTAPGVVASQWTGTVIERRYITACIDTSALP